MLWIFLSVISNATATVLLKISTLSSPSASPVSITGGLAFLFPVLVAYALALIAYRQSMIHFPVSIAYAIITSLTMLVVGVIEVFAFGETLHANRLVGLLLVCIGIFIFTS